MAPPKKRRSVGFNVELVWEEPAKRKPAISELQRAMEKALFEVKNRPGQWGRIRLYSHRNTASENAKRLRERATDDRWEFDYGYVSKDQDGELWGLYARYKQ